MLDIVPREQRAILDAALRTDFLSFLERCFMTLNPSTPFRPNWHIAAVGHQLDLVRRGKIKRLIVNLPPRYLKSIMISVAYPAFVLGHDPERRIFGVSYGADLATKHAADFRSIVESRWYQRIFPAMRIKRSTDMEVVTTQRGFRRATSIYAAITGLGGDDFILDDPQKPADSQSELLRTGLNEWFSHTLRSRLDDKENGTIILTQQRVHLQDLTGYLTEASPEWTVLSLPAIGESEEQIPLGGGRFHIRRAGEALHPEAESLATLEALRNELGSDVFGAQYQQAPVPAGGSMIRREWLRYWDQLPERTYRTKVIQSWDVAAKAGLRNDWTVCSTWIISEGAFYLMDITRGRYEYPRLRNTAIALAERYKPDKILIEDASTGIALAQDLKAEHRYAVSAVAVEHDKVGRLYVQQAKFEAGLVILPRVAPFLAALEAELLTFPQSKNDDQIDSISQALAFKPSGYRLTAESLG